MIGLTTGLLHGRDMDFGLALLVDLRTEKKWGLSSGGDTSGTNWGWLVARTEYV
jgi:hypothetical protein